MTFTHTWKRRTIGSTALTLARSISSKIIPHVHLDSEPSELSIALSLYPHDYSESTLGIYIQIPLYIFTYTYSIYIFNV